MDENVIIIAKTIGDSFNPLIMSIFEIFTYSTMLVLSCRMFGKFGLVAYSCCAIVSANLHVLKIASFRMESLTIFPEDTAALGTAAFASVFIASDAMSELWGKDSAKEMIKVGFLFQAVFSIMSLFCISYKPADNYSENCLIQILATQIRILPASTISYIISQRIDIEIFCFLSKVYKAKKLWLRSNIAGLVSNIVDAFVFNVLCWYLFGNETKTIQEVFHRYILIGFGHRLVACMLSSPALYFCSHKNRNAKIPI